MDTKDDFSADSRLARRQAASISLRGKRRVAALVSRWCRPGNDSAASCATDDPRHHCGASRGGGMSCRHRPVHVDHRLSRERLA